MANPKDYVGKGCAYTYWENTGVHFGFPECCIKSFLDQDYVFENVKFLGTGYRPCNDCNTKPYEELVNYINTNRKHPTPFPNDDGFAKDYKESMYG